MQSRKNFRFAIYAAVLSSTFTAQAGSFDDFFIAVRNDNASAVTELLDRGFDPNTRDEKGQPAMTIAIREGATKVVTLLVNRSGADVDALNQAAESPLMMAALKGDLPAAQLLIAHGAQVNRTGWAPLHYAATGPEPKLVRLLAERGAEIDAPSPNGTTPLMMAAQYGSEENVKVLLERGADANRRNQRDLRAVDFAKLSGREPLVKRLTQLSR